MPIEYSVGDLIGYRAHGGQFRAVRVKEKEADIKNGRAGFSGELVGAEPGDLWVWGYDSQIVGKVPEYTINPSRPFALRRLL